MDKYFFNMQDRKMGLFLKIGYKTVAAVLLLLLPVVSPLFSQISKGVFSGEGEKIKGLPPHLIAFPEGDESYLSRINFNGQEPVVWSVRKLEAWAQAQGYSITSDSSEGGYQFGRGLVFRSPGISYRLTAPVTARGVRQRYGWTLVIDMGLLKPAQKSRILSSDYSYYPNILRYDIYVDRVFQKTIEIGYGVTEKSPVKIYIPYIRSSSKTVLVEIRLNNHPANFAVLYDSYLTIE